MPTTLFSSPYTSVPLATIAAELEQLEKRARAINLSLAPLAARAGVKVSQISQWKAGSPVTGTTAGKHFRALWRALEEEEHKLREYLKPSRRSRTRRN
jgi:transcriptional regulator with XRE-family HTH domain